MKTTKYILFFSHAPQVQWFSFIARTLHTRLGLQSVLWVIGDKDRALGESTGEFCKVVDIIADEKHFSRFSNELAANRYLGAYEESVGKNVVNCDIAMDRYTSRANWTIEKTLVYAAGILSCMRSEITKLGQPILAIGEENCLQYRLARRIVTSPYVCLYMTGHFSDRFYIEHTMYYQWESCQKRYLSFLENGIPSDVSSIAEKKLDEIVNKRRSPEATERFINSGKASLLHRVTVSRLAGVLKRMASTLLSTSEPWNPKRLTIKSSNLFLSVSDLLSQVLVKKRLTKLTLKSIPPNQKYAGFFLHVQPEQTVEGVAFEYRDQAATARNIAASLPAGMLLLVKDHVAMVGKRPLGFYQELAGCANIKLLDHSVSPYEVVKGSSLMFTLSGSVALESMYVGKPAIVLGKIYHTAFRGIFQAGDIRELATLVKAILDGKYLPASREEAVIALAAMYSTSYRGLISSQFSLEEMAEEENMRCIGEALESEFPFLRAVGLR